MGDIERQIVSDMYPGADWKKKVKKMSDAQVLAIYFKEKDKPKKKPKKPKRDSDDIPF